MSVKKYTKIVSLEFLIYPVRCLESRDLFSVRAELPSMAACCSRVHSDGGSVVCDALQELLATELLSGVAVHRVDILGALDWLGVAAGWITLFIDLLPQPGVELLVRMLLGILLLDLIIPRLVEWIVAVLDVLFEFDVQQIKDAVQSHVARGQSLLPALIFGFERQSRLVLQTKLALSQGAFTAP